MARPGLAPQAIVLALGAGALGGPDALRLLLQFAGRGSPAVDVAICLIVISLLTVPVLGTMLLARFVRKARAGAGGGISPAATDLFARVTAVVSVGVAFLVTACLLVVPGGAVRLPIDFAVKNPFVVTIFAICGAFAFAATGSLPCAVPLLRFLRGAGIASGPAPTTPATKIKIVFLFAVSLVASIVAFACGRFHSRRSMITMPVGVAIAVVTGAGTTLLVLVRWSRRARNTAGVGGGAAARTS